MSTDLTRLLTLRDAGAVTRYHTARMLRTQNLAEHSFGVAMIILHVEPTASARLIAAALYHDLAELATGDIPAPVKWDSPELRSVVEAIELRYERNMRLDVDLDDYEKKVLKWADMFELVLWCREEMWLGNSYAFAIMQRGIHYLLHDLGPCNADAAQLLFKLQQEELPR